MWVDDVADGICDVSADSALDAVRTEDYVRFSGRAVLEMYSDASVGYFLGEVGAPFVEMGTLGVDMLDQGVQKYGAVHALRHLIFRAILQHIAVRGTKDAVVFKTLTSHNISWSPKPEINLNHPRIPSVRG